MLFTTLCKNRCPQGEVPSLHLDGIDPCDSPKRGELGCIISGSGGLRTRYPPEWEFPMWNLMKKLKLLKGGVAQTAHVKSAAVLTLLEMCCICDI